MRHQPEQQQQEAASIGDVFRVRSIDELESQPATPTSPQMTYEEQPQIQPQPQAQLQTQAPSRQALAEVREEEDVEHEHDQGDHSAGSGNSSSDSSSSTETEGDLENDIVIVEVDALAVVARRSSGAGTVSNLGRGGGVQGKALYAKKIAVEDFAVAPDHPAPAAAANEGAGMGGRGLPAIVEVM